MAMMAMASMLRQRAHPPTRPGRPRRARPPRPRPPGPPTPNRRRAGGAGGLSGNRFYRGAGAAYRAPLRPKGLAAGAISALPCPRACRAARALPLSFCSPAQQGTGLRPGGRPAPRPLRHRGALPGPVARSAAGMLRPAARRLCRRASRRGLPGRAKGRKPNRCSHA
jgi:hypothetical protein